LCASTGKAAFGIGGSTLHSMFSLPVNQAGSAFRSLSPDLLYTLRSRFIDLKVLIIDEISMPFIAFQLDYVSAAPPAL